MKKIIIILTALILSFCIIPVSAEGGSEAPLDNYNLKAVTVSDTGVFSAVGENGITLYSSDGAKWIRNEFVTDKKLNGVAWGTGVFVAVGEGGTIMTSSDAVSWTMVDSKESTDLYECVWNGSEFTAAGNDGTILRSKDGQKWERVRMATGELLYGLNWLKDRYLAVGSDSMILLSDDGISWEEKYSERPSTSILSGIAYNGKVYVATGDHLNIKISKNGEEWETEKAEINNLNQLEDAESLGIWDIKWVNGNFTAVGGHGTVIQSSDGYKWNVVPQATRKQIMGLAYNGKMFAAVGDEGTIITSVDGQKWTNLTHPASKMDMISLNEGEKAESIFHIEYADGSVSDDIKGISFEVSNSEVAKIDELGNVTAVAPGLAQIKAIYDLNPVDVAIKVNEVTVNDREGSIPQKPEASGDEVNTLSGTAAIAVTIVIIIAAVVFLALRILRRNEKK